MSTSRFEYSEQQRNEIICKESLFDQTASNTKEILDQLHLLTRRRTKVNLHAITLSDYIRQGIIPRGLRWQKEPMLRKKTDDFCDRCCAILNKCSFDLMKFNRDKKDTMEGHVYFWRNTSVDDPPQTTVRQEQANDLPSSDQFSSASSSSFLSEPRQQGGYPPTRGRGRSHNRPPSQRVKRTNQHAGAEKEANYGRTRSWTYQMRK